MQIASYEAAKAAYDANFELRATYGILAWSASSFAKAAFRLQKETIRALSSVPTRTSCRALFKKHNDSWPIHLQMSSICTQ